jgi:Uncharacterized protein conserved in bacteria
LKHLEILLKKGIYILNAIKSKRISINYHSNTVKMNLLRENFISDAPDEEAGGRVNAISQNKTLYIGQFTDRVVEPELYQDATNINQVFEHFKPSVEVDFQNEDGEIHEETIRFNEMKDFEVDNGNGQLVTNSSFLLNLKSSIDANTKMKRQIEQSKRIRDILGNKQSKQELREVLQYLLDELESNK